jgi:cell division protein FtsW
MRLNTTWLVFLCALMLVTIGVVMVYSSSAPLAARNTIAKQIESTATLSTKQTSNASAHSSFYLKRQALWAFASVLTLLCAYRIDYQSYTRLAAPLLAVSFVALLLVFVPHVGIERNGSHRWLSLGFFQLQASELAKLALIIYMAKLVAQRQSKIKSFMRGFLPSLGLLGVFLIAIVLEPDLGACVVIGLIVFIIWYVGGMRMIHLSSLGIAAVPCLIAAIIAEPYRVRRFIGFLNPEKDIHGAGMQLYQSLVAIGSGGLWGLGLGQGPQKYQFLPEAYTDFIFAVICEELGLIGAICIIAIYVFLMIQGIRVASRVPDMFGALLATGITSMISLQAFINMAVVLGLLPTKGLTLPLISYGGSSLLINMVAIGILMNVSRHAEYAANPSRRAVRVAYA